MESALTAVTGAISAQLSSGNIVTVFTTALGIALPLALVWFGIRFVYGKTKGAFRRGRM